MPEHPSTHTPVLIVGAGTGGVAAALAVADAGLSCVVTEPTDWVGGQLTSQAVPPDENPWIEGREGFSSATASYLDYRKRVRGWYRKHGGITDEAAANDRLNPGNGWVSHLCHSPAVGHIVLRDMLAPHVTAGRVTVLLEHEPVSAHADGDRVTAVTFLDRRSGAEVTVAADYILDATELGDVLQLGSVEHATGAEHRERYGELHGHPNRDDSTDQQAISWCFALEHRPDEDHTIDRPAGYEVWRDWVPPMADDPWTGPLFSWRVPSHDTMGGRTLPLVPWPDEPADGAWELWRYRRIVDRATHAGKDAPPDVSLINVVQMDYFRRPLLGVSAEDHALALAEAREQSRCFLYWMQTDAPRHDTDARTGYPGLKLRGDELGTEDGFAKAAYIREARRLLARTVVNEQHVGAEQRAAAGHPVSTPLNTPAGEPFSDSVGIGHYRMDLHPSAAMRSGIYAQACPFRIPLGALIPRRVTNVIAAGKCLGVTHVTNGCYRLHPVEWNVGEAAGALAAFCVRGAVTPAGVGDNAGRVRGFQEALCARGIPLAWPWEEVG